MKEMLVTGATCAVWAMYLMCMVYAAYAIYVLCVGRAVNVAFVHAEFAVHATYVVGYARGVRCVACIVCD